MKSRIKWPVWAACAALLYAAPAPVRAQGEETIIGGTTAATRDAALPEGGVPLIGTDPLAVLKLGGKAAAQAQIQEIEVVGQPFKRAMRVTTKAKTGEADITLSAPMVAAFKEVDTVFMRVYLRTLQSAAPDGHGMVKVNIEPNPGNTARAFYPGTVRARPEQGWVRCDSPALAMRGYGKGAARFEIRLGGEAQTVEIGGIEVLNYERRRFPHQLPHRAGGSYEGRDTNAPWRKAAQERIEQIRKGDLTVRVTGAQGHPLPGASVKVKMTRHAYPFGTAVNESFLVDAANTPDGQKYREMLKTYFNWAVLEGGHKLRTWKSSQKSRDKTIQTTNWLRENGIQVRGHTLIWPGWSNLPNELRPQYEK